MLPNRSAHTITTSVSEAQLYIEPFAHRSFSTGPSTFALREVWSIRSLRNSSMILPHPQRPVPIDHHSSFPKMYYKWAEKQEVAFKIPQAYIKC